MAYDRTFDGMQKWVTELKLQVAEWVSQPTYSPLPDATNAVTSIKLAREERAYLLRHVIHSSNTLMTALDGYPHNQHSEGIEGGKTHDILIMLTVATNINKWAEQQQQQQQQPLTYGGRGRPRCTRGGQ